MKPHRISVVIPTLDEQVVIGPSLDAVEKIPGLWETIVVDGGSADRTIEIASARDGVRVLSARRGRALQMNAGAEVAEGDVLLFLHADVRLPRSAADAIQRALSNEDAVGGAFRIRTIADEPAPWVTHLLWLANLRSHVSRLPYGDQALFVRTASFRAAGGFSPLPIMEDVDLARRLQKLGRLMTVPESVQVSGRRFLKRPVASAILMNLIPPLYRIGVPPELLSRLYPSVR